MKHKKHDDNFAMTQQEVADALGMTRPNLWTLERRAYENFKKALAKRGYKIEDVLVGMR